MPQVEETKEIPNKPRKVAKIHTSDDEDDDDVTDDSFKNPNVSLMPEDVENVKLAASLPNMTIKGAMQPKTMKIVNKPFTMNRI